jgi:hypothetical protein
MRNYIWGTLTIDYHWSRICGSLDVSQSSGPPRSVIKIAVFYFFSVYVLKKQITNFIAKFIETLRKVAQKNVIPRCGQL